ncbi:MAG: ATP-dependent RecD-like DNA helicase, partial [bacterium]|nr:ATP-dependent RecD-like DNA helicase [bacterium]
METIQGQLSTITFRAEDTGFTVARFKEDETDETITIVGNLATSTPGEVLKLTGEWANHSKFGRQFKIQSYETGTPVTVEGIENYLGSGLIKGIGPSKAKRIVEAFGIEALEIIEKSPTRLNEISGFGKKTVQIITEAWEQQKEVQQVMLFLQSHGVSSGYATKIYKQYENESIAIVKENPYRLADDIFGIGFQVADAIAGKLGFSKDSSLRIESGILYVLKNLSNNGNVFYPESLLLRESLSVLGIQNNEILNDALESL